MPLQNLLTKLLTHLLKQRKNGKRYLLMTNSNYFWTLPTWWVVSTLSYLPINVSFLVTFGDQVTKIRKYYGTFVYILQGKMCKTEKNRIKITELKWPKYQKPKYKNIQWTKQKVTKNQYIFLNLALSSKKEHSQIIVCQLFTVCWKVSVILLKI